MLVIFFGKNCVATDREYSSNSRNIEIQDDETSETELLRK